ncbi:MAG TPA: nucleoside phosphorylase [bacterium]|nr:nucleoside phosphorylase [bacterium]
MIFSDDVVAEPARTPLDARVHDPVILCPVEEITKLAAGALGGVKSLRLLHPARVYTLGLGRGRGSLVGPCMGAPVAVMVLEKCIAQGVRNFLFLGFCGSINPGLRLGDLLVVASALSEEGTSPHYFPDRFPPLAGPKATLALEQALKSERVRYQKGQVWTSDAFYRETRDKVRRYGQQGVLGVEMETSALFTVARYRGVNLGALMVVTDELFGPSWIVGYTRSVVMKAIGKAICLVRAAAVSLA